ncbi:PTS IIA-like nitrogen regulatory protein PtsN [Alishewanella sp. 16-MA]|uniref:PTS IIA-like nitrogen regulatory protein PtsN n=2 Tax=Gammaproteobacteria TaxID=1236 RepID=A0ABS8BYW1_9ALTE|nr:PTS IIA-like nitrogen regulatory protein PtsN [Alishewanella sp. SMS8]MCB5225256.1 PTS IIA-like nitrogen regulatory protein PtsN [Alishewanella maricola]MDP4944376.1 PTS IIA-like nitrogen regulatory protein PtsN [Alishewanella sp.]MDP5036307.1 PTS IIA-like nitrogen regulatory protein PtsN [Alishewanella sp.]MDP5188239.1 PTS IIA-like nitrogen regulatory protein PtsN [Alishewanella sp.]MDP5458851.1 PTS IIA-like nitrogen regulatory protein PtsN [Alishewanella sp. SMS8]
MMNLNAMLAENCTKSAVLFNSKKRILEYIAELAHQQLPELSEYTILEALMTREKLGSTGIGGGIAIPHGKLDCVTQPILVFVVSKDPIAFDAIDNQAVDIFCAILIPTEQCQTHLSTLSGIAKLLSQKDLTKKIRHVESDEQLYQLLLDYSQKTGES